MSTTRSSPLHIRPHSPFLSPPDLGELDSDLPFVVHFSRHYPLLLTVIDGVAVARLFLDRIPNASLPRRSVFFALLAETGMLLAHLLETVTFCGRRHERERSLI